jgi:TolB protein
VELDGSISPDGKWVAYAAGPIERMRIFVRAVSGGRTLALGDDVPGSHRWPRWSPDGTQIAFATRDAVYIIPAPQGGFPQRVFDATPIQAGINTGTVAWSPDGKTLAVADLRGLWLKAIDGGRPRKLVEAEQANSPAWSPDGKTLAFVSGNNTFIFGNNAPSSIWIVSASGGQPRSVTDQSHLNTSPVWTPDGRSLLYVSNRDGPRDVYEQSFRRGWRPAGQPARLSTGLNPSAITLSADGTRLAFAQFVVRASVWSAPVSPDHPTRPSEARLITDENDAIESVAISHDGKWLLYDANRNGNQDIFKLALVDSATSREPVQLTHDPGDDFGGRWSPDDREVAFYSTRFGTRDIFVMGSDGRDVQRVTSSRWEEMGPDWSPDGKQLAFGAFNGDSSNVQLTQRDEHGTWLQARVLAQSRTGFDVGSPRWSPDGRWISFTGGNLYVVEPATGRVRQLLDRATFGRIVTFAADWGRDPSIVFIHAVGADGHSFWAVPVNGGRPRLLLNLGQLSPRVQPYFATDGHRIFFTRASTEADIWLMTLKR